MELLKKMKRKEHQEMILINAPDSFSGYLSEMREVLSIREGLGEDHADFLLVFFTSIDEIEKLAPGILENVTEDPLV
ncbi:hypothetical protein [Proteiniclasticum sp.]|uniref:hypothetical protein n=1 Tax=Proteiniclasticum sp. TaxID=2053595 RepID=UPI00289D777B|nr:hypothetical protein [Proteiniclasticum sp.]